MASHAADDEACHYVRIMSDAANLTEAIQLKLDSHTASNEACHNVRIISDAADLTEAV